MTIATKGKKGFQSKGKTRLPKVPKRKNGQPLANSFKFLGRIWRQMSPAERNQFESWQNFIAKKRAGD